MATSTLDFTGRGNELKISTSLSMSMDESNCTSCGQCLNACPTAALVENPQFSSLESLLHDPQTYVMVQVAPGVNVSLGEIFGYRPGTDMGNILRVIFRRLGFDLMAESAMGADVMIIEQAEILRERRANGEWLPLITSSCPAWVQYCEMNLPWCIPHLSPLRSPVQVTGLMMKSLFTEGPAREGKKIVSVLVTPCTAAKKEAVKPDMTISGRPVIDLVLTTRELARLIRINGLDPASINVEEEAFPRVPAGQAGRLTAVAGGEAEALTRTIYLRETGSELDPTKLQRFRIQRKFREAVLEQKDRTLQIGAVSGLASAVALLQEIRTGEKQLDVLEVMACPEGCVNGGGQPLRTAGHPVRARTRAIYDQDNSAQFRTAHQNPDVSMLYEGFLDTPGGERSRQLLFRGFNGKGRNGHEQ